MGLQSGLLHLILKCDAQQQEQRTQNTHAAQRGLGELACCRQGVFFIPLILILPRTLGLMGVETGLCFGFGDVLAFLP